jgi:hypothetical protein
MGLRLYTPKTATRGPGLRIRYKIVSEMGGQRQKVTLCGLHAA